MANQRLMILATGKTLSIVVNKEDLTKTNPRLFAYKKSKCYDINNGYKCYEKGIKSLHKTFISEVEGLIPRAVEVLRDLQAEQLERELEIDRIRNNAQDSNVSEIKIQAKQVRVNEVVHSEFESILAFVKENEPVYLSGPAGSGKNVICKQVAKALGLEFYFTNAVKNEYKLTGFIDANGRYHETQLYKAMTKGGLFFLDEMDASIPEALIILNGAIANRYFDFPTGKVDAHPDFRIIAAGNTFGTGQDDEYTGRYQLDASSLDRFAEIDINYDEEIDKISANYDEQLVKFIREYRRASEKAGIKQIASYRGINRISKMRKHMELTKVLKTCLTKGLAVDDINTITWEMRGLSGNEYYQSLMTLVQQLQMMA